MPSGNLSLIEASKSGSDQKKRGVVETIIHEAAMAEILPWTPFAGNALKHSEEGTLPDVQFRRVNEGYTSSYGQDNEHFWGVAILGGEVTVDRFLVDVVGTEEDLEAKQWAKLAKANSMRFSLECFDGTGSAASKGFKGINTLIDEGFGQKLDMGAAAMTLAKLDEAIDLFENQGMPDAMMINRTLRRKITSLARTTATGVSLIDVGTDVFGRKVNMYDGVPMRIIGKGINSSGTVEDILAFDEASSTSSIYLAKFGEDDVTGLLGKGGSFSVESFGELQSGPQRMGRLEWYPGVAIFNKYSIVRFHGITNA